MPRPVTRKRPQSSPLAHSDPYEFIPSREPVELPSKPVTFSSMRRQTNYKRKSTGSNFTEMKKERAEDYDTISITVDRVAANGTSAVFVSSLSSIPLAVRSEVIDFQPPEDCLTLFEKRRKLENGTASARKNRGLIKWPTPPVLMPTDFELPESFMPVMQERSSQDTSEPKQAEETVTHVVEVVNNNVETSTDVEEATSIEREVTQNSAAEMLDDKGENENENDDIENNSEVVSTTEIVDDLEKNENVDTNSIEYTEKAENVNISNKESETGCSQNDRSLPLSSSLMELASVACLSAEIDALNSAASISPPAPTSCLNSLRSGYWLPLKSKEQDCHRSACQATPNLVEGGPVNGDVDVYDDLPKTQPLPGRKMRHAIVLVPDTQPDVADDRPVKNDDDDEECPTVVPDSENAQSLSVNEVGVVGATFHICTRTDVEHLSTFLLTELDRGKSGTVEVHMVHRENDADGVIALFNSLKPSLSLDATIEKPDSSTSAGIVSLRDQTVDAMKVDSATDDEVNLNDNAANLSTDSVGDVADDSACRPSAQDQTRGAMEVSIVATDGATLVLENAMATDSGTVVNENKSADGESVGNDNSRNDNTSAASTPDDSAGEIGEETNGQASDATLIHDQEAHTMEVHLAETDGAIGVVDDVVAMDGSCVQNENETNAETAVVTEAVIEGALLDVAQEELVDADTKVSSNAVESAMEDTDIDLASDEDYFGLDWLHFEKDDDKEDDAAEIAESSKTDDHSYWWEGSSRIVFCTSGFIDKRDIVAFSEVFGARHEESFSSDVTHVVMKAVRKGPHVMSTVRTPKYLRGIALRKWVVSSEWIEQSVKRRRLLSPVQFEVHGNVDTGLHFAPLRARLDTGKLLHDVSAYFHGPFDNEYPEVFLKSLLLDAGGTVIDKVDMVTVEQANTSKTCLILTNQTNNAQGLGLLYDQYKLPIVSIEWLLTCVNEWLRIPYLDYKLCPLDQYDEENAISVIID